MLCLVVIGAWVRGYFVSDTVGYGRGSPGGKMWALAIMHGRGGVGLAVVTHLDYTPQLNGPFHQQEPAGYAGDLGKEPMARGALGFLFVKIAPTLPERGWAVALPLWFVLLLLAPWPAWHLRTAWWGRKERRQRLGLCLRCGYDMRASAERCPECGELKPLSPPLESPDRAVPGPPNV